VVVAGGLSMGHLVIFPHWRCRRGDVVIKVLVVGTHFPVQMQPGNRAG
jgi:hypothetical protein